MLVNIAFVRRSKRKHLPARKADALLVGLVATAGIVKPITVKKWGANYLIIDGNRRLDAAYLCGMLEVPIIVV